MRWRKLGWCLPQHAHEINSIENRVSHFFFVFTRLCTGSASRMTQMSIVGRSVQWQRERMANVAAAAAAAALGRTQKLIFLPLIRWQVRSVGRGGSCCEPSAWSSLAAIASRHKHQQCTVGPAPKTQPCAATPFMHKECEGLKRQRQVRGQCFGRLSLFACFACCLQRDVIAGHAQEYHQRAQQARRRVTLCA
jgi:hypothetical protein